MNKILALTAASGLALAGMAAAAPAAQAKDDSIKMRGACASPSTSTWAVKVKNKKGQLRADFWVKTAAAGQPWDFRLVRVNGETQTLLSERTRTTVASDDESGDDSRSVTRISFRDRGGDDDGPDHDIDDDSVTGIDDSQGSSSSSSSSSRSHVAEAKFRTWIPNSGTKGLMFTATFNGETCTVML